MWRRSPRTDCCSRIRKRRVALLITALALAGCGTRAVRPGAAVRLAYGGAPGANAAWNETLTLRGEVAFGGFPQLVVVTLRARIRETVTAVEPDGRRRVTQAWIIQPPEIDGMPVPVEGVPPRTELALVRAPDGEMWTSSGSGGDGALGWLLRAAGGFFPQLPLVPVAPGETWTRTSTTGGGEAALTASFDGRFEGRESAAPTVTDLTVSGAASLAGAAAGTGGSVSEFHLDHHGTVRFDAAAGRVVESRQTGTLKLQAKAGKTALSVRARFESVLVPAPEPRLPVADPPP